MKQLKRFEGNRIVLWSYERGGYYILRIMNYNTSLVATKRSRNSHIEHGWGVPYEKKFQAKESANKYFLSIKRNHSDLKMVSCEDWKYISYDGKIKEMLRN